MNEDTEKSQLSGDKSRFVHNPFVNPNGIDFEFNDEINPHRP